MHEFCTLQSFKSAIWLIWHRICQLYPSKRYKTAPFVSMPSGTGHPREYARLCGFLWESPPGPARLFCVRYLLLAISSASVTFFSHRFSMETPFMRTSRSGNIWKLFILLKAREVPKPSLYRWHNKSWDSKAGYNNCSARPRPRGTGDRGAG